MNVNYPHGSHPPQYGYGMVPGYPHAGGAYPQYPGYPPEMFQQQQRASQLGYDTHDPRSNGSDPRAHAPDPRADPRGHVPDPRGHAPDQRSHMPDPRGHVPDPRGHALDPRADPRVHAQDQRGHAPETRSHASDPRGQIPDPRSRAPDSRDPAPDLHMHPTKTPEKVPSRVSPAPHPSQHVAHPSQGNMSLSGPPSQHIQHMAKMGPQGTHPDMPSSSSHHPQHRGSHSSGQPPPMDQRPPQEYERTDAPPRGHQQMEYPPQYRGPPHDISATAQAHGSSQYSNESSSTHFSSHNYKSDNQKPDPSKPTKQNSSPSSSSSSSTLPGKPRRQSNENYLIGPNHYRPKPMDYFRQKSEERRKSRESLSNMGDSFERKSRDSVDGSSNSGDVIVRPQSADRSSNVSAELNVSKDDKLMSVKLGNAESNYMPNNQPPLGYSGSYKVDSISQPPSVHSNSSRSRSPSFDKSQYPPSKQGYPPSNDSRSSYTYQSPKPESIQRAEHYSSSENISRDSERSREYRPPDQNHERSSSEPRERDRTPHSRRPQVPDTQLMRTPRAELLSACPPEVIGYSFAPSFAKNGYDEHCPRNITQIRNEHANSRDHHPAEPKLNRDASRLPPNPNTMKQQSERPPESREYKSPHQNYPPKPNKPGEPPSSGYPSPNSSAKAGDPRYGIPVWGDPRMHPGTEQTDKAYESSEAQKHQHPNAKYGFPTSHDPAVMKQMWANMEHGAQYPKMDPKMMKDSDRKMIPPGENIRVNTDDARHRSAQNPMQYSPSMAHRYPGMPQEISPNSAQSRMSRSDKYPTDYRQQLQQQKEAAQKAAMNQQTFNPGYPHARSLSADHPRKPTDPAAPPHMPSRNPAERPTGESGMVWPGMTPDKYSHMYPNRKSEFPAQYPNAPTSQYARPHPEMHSPHSTQAKPDGTSSQFDHRSRAASDHRQLGQYPKEGHPYSNAMYDPRFPGRAYPGQGSKEMVHHENARHEQSKVAGRGPFTDPKAQQWGVRDQRMYPQPQEGYRMSESEKRAAEINNNRNAMEKQSPPGYPHGSNARPGDQSDSNRVMDMYKERIANAKVPPESHNNSQPRIAPPLSDVQRNQTAYGSADQRRDAHTTEGVPQKRKPEGTAEIPLDLSSKKPKISPTPQHLSKPPLIPLAELERQSFGGRRDERFMHSMPKGPPQMVDLTRSDGQIAWPKHREQASPQTNSRSREYPMSPPPNWRSNVPGAPNQRPRSPSQSDTFRHSMNSDRPRSSSSDLARSRMEQARPEIDRSRSNRPDVNFNRSGSADNLAARHTRPNSADVDVLPPGSSAGSQPMSRPNSTGQQRPSSTGRYDGAREYRPGSTDSTVHRPSETYRPNSADMARQPMSNRHTKDQSQYPYTATGHSRDQRPYSNSDPNLAKHNRYPDGSYKPTKHGERNKPDLLLSGYPGPMEPRPSGPSKQPDSYRPSSGDKPKTQAQAGEQKNIDKQSKDSPVPSPGQKKDGKESPKTDNSSQRGYLSYFVPNPILSALGKNVNESGKESSPESETNTSETDKANEKNKSDDSQSRGHGQTYKDLIDRAIEFHTRPKGNESSEVELFRKLPNGVRLHKTSDLPGHRDLSSKAVPVANVNPIVKSSDNPDALIKDEDMLLAGEAVKADEGESGDTADMKEKSLDEVKMGVAGDAEEAPRAEDIIKRANPFTDLPDKAEIESKLRKIKEGISNDKAYQSMLGDVDVCRFDSSITKDIKLDIECKKITDTIQSKEKVVLNLDDDSNSLSSVPEKKVVSKRPWSRKDYILQRASQAETVSVPPPEDSNTSAPNDKSNSGLNTNSENTKTETNTVKFDQICEKASSPSVSETGSNVTRSSSPNSSVVSTSPSLRSNSPRFFPPSSRTKKSEKETLDKHKNLKQLKEGKGKRGRPPLDKNRQKAGKSNAAPAASADKVIEVPDEEEPKTVEVPKKEERKTNVKDIKPPYEKPGPACKKAKFAKEAALRSKSEKEKESQDKKPPLKDEKKEEIEIKELKETKEAKETETKKKEGGAKAKKTDEEDETKKQPAKHQKKRHTRKQRKFHRNTISPNRLKSAVLRRKRKRVSYNKNAAYEEELRKEEERRTKLRQEQRKAFVKSCKAYQAQLAERMVVHHQIEKKFLGKSGGLTNKTNNTLKQGTNIENPSEEYYEDEPTATLENIKTKVQSKKLKGKRTVKSRKSKSKTRSVRVIDDVENVEGLVEGDYLDIQEVEIVEVTDVLETKPDKPNYRNLRKKTRGLRRKRSSRTRKGNTADYDTDATIDLDYESDVKQDCDTPLSKQTTSDHSREASPEKKRLVLCRDTGETFLHKAARLGYTDVAKQCLEKNDVPVNARDHAGYTPLHEACVNGHLATAEILIQHGASLNLFSMDGARPIHDAVVNNHVDIVRLLLQAGSDPTSLMISGKSPLRMARTPEMKSFLKGYLVDLNGTHYPPPTDDEEDESDQDEYLTQEIPWKFLPPFDREEPLLLTAPPDSDGENGESMEFYMFPNQPPLVYNICLDDKLGVRNYVMLDDVLRVLNVDRDTFTRENKEVCVHNASRRSILNEVHKRDCLEKKDQLFYICRENDSKVLTFVEANNRINKLLKGSPEKVDLFQSSAFNLYQRRDKDKKMKGKGFSFNSKDTHEEKYKNQKYDGQKKFYVSSNSHGLDKGNSQGKSSSSLSLSSSSSQDLSHFDFVDETDTPSGVPPTGKPNDQSKYSSSKPSSSAEAYNNKLKAMLREANYGYKSCSKKKQKLSTELLGLVVEIENLSLKESINTSKSSDPRMWPFGGQAKYYYMRKPNIHPKALQLPASIHLMPYENKLVRRGRGFKLIDSKFGNNFTTKSKISSSTSSSECSKQKSRPHRGPHKDTSLPVLEKHSDGKRPEAQTPAKRKARDDADMPRLSISL